MRTIFFTLFFMVFPAAALLAGSLNFQVSDQYTVTGQPITFTFTYDPQGGDVPKLLVIELNYDDDKTVDYTMSFNENEIKGTRINLPYTMTFDRAGYFNATATFNFTWIDENGKESKNKNEIGPIKINVAKWKFTAENTLGCIESTPAVSSDGKTVYVGSENGNLYAINTNDGTEQWHFSTAGPVNSSPALDSFGNIFFGSEDGFVYSLDPGGILRWCHATDFPVFSSPAIDADLSRIYIGSNDTCLHALDADTGELLWKFKTNAKIVSSPVIGHDRTVYIGSLDKCLYAVTPEGYELWKFQADSEILNSPAIDKDGTLFFGTASFRGEVNDSNGLYALSGTGNKKWFIQHASGFAGTPVIDSTGTVCVGSNNNTLYGISRTGGELVMYKKFSSDLIASSALGSNGYIFAGAGDGIFYGLNLLKGDDQSGRNEIWKYNLSLPITTSSPVIKNGYVYVGACGYTSGALFSFLCDADKENLDTNPSGEAPWPLFRNMPDNSGITMFRPYTIYPEIVSTDPEKDLLTLDFERKSISITFSMPMEPSSIYEPPDPDIDYKGYYGFTVEPFDSPVEDFTIAWNNDYTIVTLTLPETESFGPDITYTATLLSKAHAKNDPERSIMYPFSWNFSSIEEETLNYSYSPGAGGCFISNLLDFFM